MHIRVTRFKSDDDATLSMVSLNAYEHATSNHHFECFGLEDEYRADKVPGETRIPAGRYTIKLRTIGGHHARYSQKFPDFHKGMLQIMDVPGFTDILIHIGNTDEDTAGCLLVGQNANTSGELSVTASTAAYKALYKKVVAAAENEFLFITFEDED